MNGRLQHCIVRVEKAYAEFAAARNVQDIHYAWEDFLIYFRRALEMSRQYSAQITCLHGLKQRINNAIYKEPSGLQYLWEARNCEEHTLRLEDGSQPYAPMAGGTFFPKRSQDELIPDLPGEARGAGIYIGPEGVFINGEANMKIGHLSMDGLHAENIVQNQDGFSAAVLKAERTFHVRPIIKLNTFVKYDDRKKVQVTFRPPTYIGHTILIHGDADHLASAAIEQLGIIQAELKQHITNP